MRFTCSLILLVVSFIVNSLSFTAAEDTSLNNKLIPASNTELIDRDNSVRRLRGKQKVNNEERMFVPPVAAYMNLLDSTSTISMTSTQILHDVENNTPLPKWAKALIVVLSLGAAAGVVVGGVKLTNVLTKSMEENSGSA